MSSDTFAQTPPSENVRGVKRKSDDDHNSHSSPRVTKKYRTRTVQRALRKEARSRPKASNSRPTTTKQPPYTPDSEFFLDDGDIYAVFDGILFCVHREKLIGAGGLLEDLVGGGESGAIRPSQDETLYDLPCIKIPMVSARNFRVLLAFLYGKIAVSKFLPNGKPLLYWEAAVVLLEISHQLDLSETRRATLAGLEYLFPSSGKVAPFKPVIAGMRSKEEQDNFYRIFPIQAISVFQKYNIPAMLPMAYYHAAQVSTRDIVLGVDDGIQLHKLSPEDTVIVLQGRERLRIARRDGIYCWMEALISEALPTLHPPPAKTAFDKAPCRQWDMKSGEKCWIFTATLQDRYRHEGFFERFNALDGVQPKSKALLKQHICNVCYDKVMVHMATCLETCWDSLPKYFGLDPWEDLYRIQRAFDGDYTARKTESNAEKTGGNVV